MNLKNKVPRKPKRSHRQSASSRSYASARTHAILNGLIGFLLTAFISFYFFLTPLNLQSTAFWLTLIVALFVFAALKSLIIVGEAAGRMQDQAAGSKTWQDVCGHEGRLFILPLIAAIALLLIALSGSTIFSAHKYASILNVQDAVFSDDLSESLGTDSIALILQIHDELLIEATLDEVDAVKAILKEEMEHAATLAVPLEIDMHTGHNWYELK